MDIAFFLIFKLLVWYEQASAEPPIMKVLPNGLRVYDIKNMYNFDIEDYLNEYAPHLLPYAEDLE